MGLKAHSSMTLSCAVGAVLSHFSHVDNSPPGSSVHGILQARILEWVAIPFSRASSRTMDQTESLMFPELAGRSMVKEAHDPVLLN